MTVSPHSLSDEFMAFMANEADAMTDGTIKHTHPAPSYLELYQRILKHSNSFQPIGNEAEYIQLSFDDLVIALDLIARFSSQQTLLGKTYESMDTCRCFTLSDQDLTKLREEVI